jgi:hypothetical protein
MPPYPFALLTLLALLMASASVRAAEKDNKIPDELRTMLEKADQLELLSLNPLDGPEVADGAPVRDRPKADGKDRFHDWGVLGKVTVTDAETREKLVAAFEKGVAGAQGVEGATKCDFSPRHGIRVTHARETADFVICFTCGEVVPYAGDVSKGGFRITQTPRSLFDDVLKKARVPLAP